MRWPITPSVTRSEFTLASAARHQYAGQTTARSATRLSNLAARAIFRSVANALPIPPPGFDDLTPEEKVSYVGALWDRIVDDQQRLPISEAQRALLRDRLAAHEADPGAARPWSEVRRDVERALASRGSR